MPANRSAALGSGDACNARIDFATKCPEIDGLGEKRFGATLHRLALSLGISVRGNHNYRDVRSSGFGFGQELKTSHAWHVDVGQDQNERYARRISDALKCRVTGLGK